jgi:hypothetical protein
MADKHRDKPEPTQKTSTGARTGETERTPGGLEVPVPTRDEFFGNLRKAARHRANDEMPSRLCDDDARRGTRSYGT